MEQGKNLLRIFLITCCIILPFENSAEGAEPSPIINKDVNSQKYVSEDNRKLEQLKRDKIEETQNFGINAGLYVQGLPVKTDAEGGNVYDPLFILSNHYNAQHCDAEAINNKGCDQRDSLLANGDIKLSTLLSGTLLDEARLNAAKWFIQNLIDPFPSTTFQDEQKFQEYLKNPAEQPKLAQALAIQTLMSVARQPFAEMVAKRSPGEKGMSVMQKMEEGATKKYLNQEWLDLQAKGYEAAVAKKSGLEPLYDIATLEAYQAWIALEQYKQGERIEALLAAIVVQLGSGAKLGQGVVTQTQETGVTESGVLKGTDITPKPEGGNTP